MRRRLPSAHIPYYFSLSSGLGREPGDKQQQTRELDFRPSVPFSARNIAQSGLSVKNKNQGKLEIFLLKQKSFHALIEQSYIQSKVTKIFRLTFKYIYVV